MAQKIIRHLAAFAALACLTQVKAGCFCGLTAGKDVCHSSPDCAPLVVRPQALPKIDLTAFIKPGQKGLKQLSDLCSCRRTIVTPALVPRPACVSCTVVGGPQDAQRLTSGSATTTQGQTYQASQQSYVHDESHHHNSDRYDHHYQHEELAPHQTAAADPVSLSLAYRMQHKGCDIHEDKLNFGFRSMPKEIKIEKKINNIPEENLFRLNGDIVELRKIQCSGKSLDEEAAEDLMDEEFLNEELVDEAPVRKLSYGEIGFGPASIKSGKFSTIEGHGEVSQVQTREEGRPCNDGFVGGKMIVQSIPQREVYSPPLLGPSPCDSIEEIDESQGSVPVPYPAFKYSSSSSSSNQNSCSSASQTQSAAYLTQL